MLTHETGTEPNSIIFVYFEIEKEAYNKK